MPLGIDRAYLDAVRPNLLLRSWFRSGRSNGDLSARTGLVEGHNVSVAAEAKFAAALVQSVEAALIDVPENVEEDVEMLAFFTSLTAFDRIE